jgi:hypothetical protein
MPNEERHAVVLYMFKRHDPAVRLCAVIAATLFAGAAFAQPGLDWAWGPDLAWGPE